MLANLEERQRQKISARQNVILGKVLRGGGITTGRSTRDKARTECTEGEREKREREREREAGGKLKEKKSMHAHSLDLADPIEED